MQHAGLDPSPDLCRRSAAAALSHKGRGHYRNRRIRGSNAEIDLAQATRLRSDARPFDFPRTPECPWNCSPTHRSWPSPIIGVCLLGVSKGGFLGLGVMALPLMSLFVPPLQAAAIILPTALAQDALTLWIYRRDWSAWNLKLMLPSMIVGMFVAWLLAASLSAAHIRLAIGLIAALFVLRHWLSGRFERWTPAPNTATGIVFGAIGGITTMLANAGGPAWQIHLLPQKLDKLPYIGTVAILFAASNVIKIPGFATLGFLTRDNLLVGLALVPIAVASNYAGIWLVRRTSNEMFFRIAYVLMFFIAVELMRSSIVELWWRLSLSAVIPGSRAARLRHDEARLVACANSGGAGRFSALTRATKPPAPP